MKTTIKKLAVILIGVAAVWLAYGFSANEVEKTVTQAVVAATIPPLQQCVAAADGGFPTSAFCTMYNNNNNLLRAGANTVSATQAPTLCPKTGCIYTGAAKFDNTGLVIGTNTAGLTAEMGKMLIQTADAGIIKVGAVGNDIRMSHNLPGAQYLRVTNESDGGLDGGQYMHLMVQGAAVSELTNNGYYRQVFTSGADGGYGDATTFSAESPHTAFYPIEMYFFTSGAYSGTEVVTLRIMAYDDLDAGRSLGSAPETSITFDGGNTTATVSNAALWNQLAASLSNNFNRLPSQRIVLDAKSDAGTTVIQITALVTAIQN